MNPKDYPRTGGLLMFATGASVSAWFYQSTIERAATQESMIIGLPWAFAALVSLGCMGLGLMIFGNQMQTWSAGLKSRKKGVMDFLIIGLFVLPGLIAFYLLQRKLEEFGYK